MRRPLGISILLLTFLCACASVDSLNRKIFGSEAVDGEVAPADGSAQSAGSGQEAPPLPKRKPGQSAEATTERADPILEDPDPERLVGLDFAATRALLGDPSRRLERPPAQVWAYDGGICMFNVFFYPSMEDNVFRVLTYEVAGLAPGTGGAGTEGAEERATDKPDKDGPLAKRCFIGLLAGRKPVDAG